MLVDSLEPGWWGSRQLLYIHGLIFFLSFEFLAFPWQGCHKVATNAVYGKCKVGRICLLALCKGDFLPSDLIGQETDKWVFSVFIWSGSSKNWATLPSSCFEQLWYLGLPRLYDFIAWNLVGSNTIFFLKNQINKLRFEIIFIIWDFSSSLSWDCRRVWDP